ncbi:DUF58 domain-containing protein [Oleiharenicola lentus]|uniref:DUF58 domain-containing protein n=1 Tax=Oleiharenicola lentus TaxID=2508720 RepID=UPI003F672D11
MPIFASKEPAATAAAPRKKNSVASALGMLRRLEWKVQHAVQNTLIGEYRSVFRGRGMEFDQVVRYEFGDDIRDIDWNVTAKLGEPYRKKFVEERELTVLIIFEDSLALQFGSGNRTKRDALMEIAGLLMMLASQNRDHVGIIHAQPGGYKLFHPVRGHKLIMQTAAEFIARPAPALDDDRPIAAPWKFVSRAVPANSILVWLGDFPPREKNPEGWLVTRQRYQPIGFRVEDPWERALPDGKPLTVYDPASQQLVVLDPKSRAHLDGHASWRAERDASFKRLFPSPLSRMVLTPDEPALDALARFFHGHMRLRTR